MIEEEVKAMLETGAVQKAKEMKGQFLSKKGRWKQTSHKLKESELYNPILTLQNGGFASFERPVKGERFHVQNRFKRCNFCVPLQDFALSRKITITAEYLPGRLNTEADWASKHFQYSSK